MAAYCKSHRGDSNSKLIPKLTFFKNSLYNPIFTNTANKNPFFSIIIPTYNVEKYIARAIESCINQSFKNIEILIIDDCGSDNSINIARDYVKKDLRIRIIHNKKNLGTFQTRLEGIKKIKGEYVLFLDADDYLDFKACERIYEALQKSIISSKMPKQNLNSSQNLKSYNKKSKSYNNEFIENLPDIVFFGMRFDPSTWKHLSPPIITKPLFKEEILYEVFVKHKTPPWHICGKAYKTSLIKQTNSLILTHRTMLHLTMAEDALKSFYLCALSKKSIGIKDKLYVYCSSQSSITRKIDISTRDKKVLDLQKVIDELDYLKNIKEIATHKHFNIAQTNTIKILKSAKALEYRYDEPLAIGGGDKWILSPYLKACLRSLGFHRKWQSYARILLYLISLGKIKL
ncbi:glycosyltransferase family 2 protein [Helicobacter sp. MIT 14-3879]|uniref:glycosyltransferase family 2 protein n=1 Tax=Helicobacter sp. MIT 14-3879 TaxID=2040649 RepID=UPI000E1E7B98|nr:glycosyltransferase family 2 protein [Helicobacter sp. MIT 14-3879]RDU64003.1 hypothetical protein CQA44_05015 [Helicobacter sp. MIT 14-3879]